MFRNLDTPRRLILSVGLSVALVTCAGEIEVKKNIRNGGTGQMWNTAPI